MVAALGSPDDELDVEPLLRRADVMRRLQVTRNTVDRLIANHGLRSVRIGRELRFKREWLEDFIERTGRGTTGKSSRRRRN
jgi:excisionase family DNA binding protein